MTQIPLSFDNRKILYIHKAGPGWGGAQQNVFDLVKHFRNLFGATVFVGNKSLLFEKIRTLQVKCRPAPLAQTHALPLSLTALGAILLAEQPDIVHSNHRYPTLLLHILRGMLRLQFSILHTARSVFNTKTHIRFLGDLTIANSRAVQKNLVEQFKLPPEKIEIIYDGIQTNSRQPISLRECSDPVFQLLNSTSKTIIGCIGNLVQAKGHIYLLQALTHLPASIRDQIIVLIVGDGPLKKMLKSEVQKSDLTDVVKFLGYQPDVFRILSYCHFVVIPSIQEGLPNVLFESYLLSKPVIASALDYVYETIVPHQIGLTFPVGDTQQLAAAIQQYIKQPDMAEHHGQIGQRLVKDWFSLERNLNQYQRAYEKLLAA
ncbi:MAG: glycosyltransferase family 4 protein [candidate division KSB1 bacterium]|nr:glycosyltransferase family 4 protein [candidate division KSB1 bacterium]MDZ7341336.1 glycosyltransferase family 4 protein [candidate division KSB1 bacterium]